MITNRTIIGWGFVAVQAILLIALVILPGRQDWPTPSLVSVAGGGLILIGLAVIAIAALRLGPALTPTPVPTESGALTTTGLYKFVRHPIYTGVLAVVIGLTIRSGSFITLVVAIFAVAFFHLKAVWEEARLAERYPEYTAYAAKTPRFIPGFVPRFGPGSIRGFGPGSG